MYVYVHVCIRVRVCIRVCVCVRICVCVMSPCILCPVQVEAMNWRKSFGANGMTNSLS